MKGKKVAESEVVMIHIPMPEELNEHGTLHGGHVFRHIDNAAGIVAQRHARSLVVTRKVDSIDFLAPIYSGQPMILKASLHLVGRSSMEIGVRVETENPLTGDITHAATCFMTYVAIDENDRPIDVPALILETDDEYRRQAAAKARREQRKNSG